MLQVEYKDEVIEVANLREEIDYTKISRNMTAKEIARLIDISAVRTAHTYSDIVQIVEYAKKYRFINVHVLPCWGSTLAELLKGEKDIFVGAPVGFPSGAHKTEVKVLEAELLLKDGVQEMDIAMNVGKLKNDENDYVLSELKEIIDIAKGKALVKVIIEINALTEYESDKACDIVIESGADYIKTGTGWIPGSANLDLIKRIKKRTHGIIKLKAAGGIRTREEFDALLDMGVERFGINTNSAIEILKTYEFTH